MQYRISVNIITTQSIIMRKFVILQNANELILHPIMFKTKTINLIFILYVIKVE